ncbi:unnamed protein product [marine sediment metagenome]|uniref:Uncharacterized protein n=1 Tax=marine sediment metagenome TaxID=412755 RepID=X1FC18_9ZZZZ
MKTTMKEIKEKVSVSLSPETMDKLDNVRGEASKSEYIRGLVEIDLSGVSAGQYLKDLRDIIQCKEGLIAIMRRDALAIMASAKNMANNGRIK